MPEQQAKPSSLTSRIRSTLFGSPVDVGIVILVASILATDLFLRIVTGDNHGIAVFYVLPGLLTLWVSRRRAPLLVAGTSSALLMLALLLGRHFGPLRLSLFEDLTGAAVCLFAIWVTAYLSLWRRAVEAEVEAHRDTIATTLSSIADAVITTDCDDRITFMNPSACNATGWSAKRADGLNLYQVFHIETSEGEEASDLIPHGKPQQFVLTSRHGTRLDVEATSAVIRDSDPDHLGRKRGQVLVFRDISDRVRQHTAMERLAYRDALTGLPNRMAFFDRIDQELARARRDSSSVALLFLDLDGFKQINDLHGHAAGDYLLKVVAGRLTESLREVDTVARLAGDEFTVILPGVADNKSARMVAEKLLLAVGSPIDIVGQKVRVTPSIGIALYPSNALDREDLLQRADQAMYQAKSSGGYRACCFQDEAAEGPGRAKPRAEQREQTLEETGYWRQA